MREGELLLEGVALDHDFVPIDARALPNLSPQDLLKVSLGNPIGNMNRMTGPLRRTLVRRQQLWKRRSFLLPQPHIQPVQPTK